MTTYTNTMSEAFEPAFVPTLLEVIDEEAEYNFSPNPSPESTINSCFLPQIFEYRPAYNFIDPMEICSTLEEETPEYRSLNLISDDVTIYYLENERKESELKNFYEMVVEPAHKQTHAEFLKEQFKRPAFEPLKFSFPTYQLTARFKDICESLWYDKEILHFEVEAYVPHEKYSKISFADFADITICDGLKWGSLQEIKKDIKPSKSCLRSKTNPHYEIEMEEALEHEEHATVEELEEYIDYCEENFEDQRFLAKIQEKKESAIARYHEEVRKEKMIKLC